MTNPPTYNSSVTGYNDLKRAIRSFDCDLVRVLMAEGTPVSEGALSTSALHLAVAWKSIGTQFTDQRRLEIVKLLLGPVPEKKIINAPDAAGCTALHLAIGDPALVHYLIEQGADIPATYERTSEGLLLCIVLFSNTSTVPQRCCSSTAQISGYTTRVCESPWTMFESLQIRR